MKRLVFMVVFSLLLVPFIGCTSSESDGMVSMMGKIPEGAGNSIFMDFQALRGDDDLEDLLAEFEDAGVYWLDMIDIDDVNTIAICGSYADNIILNGKFNLDDIREELDDLDCNDDEYKNVEIWGSYDEYWFALLGSLIIMGLEDDVKDCIDVIKDGEDSMLDDNDFKEVMDRLPGGIMVKVGTDGGYPGEEAWGYSFKKKDDDTLKMTAIFKFKNEDASVDAVDEIEEDIEEEEEGPHNIQVDQDGEFVIASAEMDIADWMEMLQAEEQDAEQSAEEKLHTAQLAVTAACTEVALNEQSVFPLVVSSSPAITKDYCHITTAAPDSVDLESLVDNYLIGGLEALGTREYDVSADGLVTIH